jgi:hypothetical protein
MTNRLMHRGGRVTSFLLLTTTSWALFLTGSASAQVRVAEAVRADRSPRMDGTLDDPLWQSAKSIPDFRQREPNEAQPPTEKTEVRILYTRNAVYFGIHCYDSEPSRIIATELRRDVSQEFDDHFEILIDSNHDRRGAYVFQVNPLGTQNDGLVVEEQGGSDGGDFDRGWDGVWTSEARITPDGWTATIEIAFSTLNFTQSNNVVWGLNFKRFIRRKNEEDLWSAYRRTFGITKVSQAGDLIGIKEIGSGRLFIVKPYGIAQYDKQTGQDAKFPLTGGLDIKYGVTSNVLLNLTGNTDFADTEVDLEAYNLTPFKVFIPDISVTVIGRLIGGRFISVPAICKILTWTKRSTMPCTTASPFRRYTHQVSGFTGPPVSFTPFLDDVGKRLKHQYVLTFLPKPQKKAGWQRIRLMTEVPNTDLVAPRKVWIEPETHGE